ncbi:MAG: 50S ribosomal protein L6 [Candidatus Daviesbacteria bacterium]|nr:MAG: 50S ribosomal protein L6 [Candidatus Daviesbacteria bacterium]
MSRVGNLPISIPNSVTVEKTGSKIVVAGPKGSLELMIHRGINVEVDDSQVLVKRKNDEPKLRALHGLIRNLIANMVMGVSEGWSKNLELFGVGFRAAGGGDKLTLNVGFSHPVEVQAPEGINFEVRDSVKIKVSGIDKQLVGQIAANIKKIKVPDVYKGKGIRYEGEYIRKKPGKAGKVGGAT